MEKLKQIYLTVCISIILIGSLYIFYALVIDGVYVNIPITTDTWTVKTDYNVYKAGDSVAIKWQYCKGVDTVSDISITLTDGIVYFLPMIHSERDAGCYNSYSVITRLPKVIPPGYYYLSGNIHFKVNPFKDIDYKVTSNYFKIK